MPQTPGQQTRNAVTRRITAHVTAWPRLGEPLVRHRGQYCYVAALLPGRSDPTPILRLHYQGSADHWAIAIYNGQYTEAELPGSFGEATGTPEEGIDDILVLYADPEPETDRAHPDTRQNCESRAGGKAPKNRLPVYPHHHND